MNLKMRILSMIWAAMVISGCATLTQDPYEKPPEELMKMAEDAFASRQFQQTREYLDALISRDGEKKYYAKAQLMKADTYFTTESYVEAAVEYQAFLDVRTYHEDAPYAQYRLALCYFNQIESVDRGYENISRAKKEFETLLKRYPRNSYREMALSKIARCRNMLAEYEDYVGTFYFNKKAYDAAIGRYKRLLVDYPDSMVEMDVMLRLGQAYEEKSEKDKATEVFNRLIEKYPTSSQADEARDILKGF